MVGITIRHCAKWLAPSPLWAEQSTAGVRIADGVNASAPSILRFATDEFMEQLLETTNRSPRQIREFVARPETWRQPMASPPPAVAPERETAVAALLGRVKRDADARRAGLEARLNAFAGRPLKLPVPVTPVAEVAQPLKLYHSAHQRHYLISASLICREPGLPDAPVALNKGEKVSFVLRRLVPPQGVDPELAAQPDSSWQEYAYIARGNAHVWQRVGAFDGAATRQLLPLEEQTPLFPVSHPGDCCQRQMHCGVIPVAKREQLLGAPAEGGSDVAPAAGEAVPFAQRSLARVIFQQDVAEPWKALINQAQYKIEQLSRGAPSSFEADADEESRDRNRAFATLRDQIQSASWYVLLDFAKFLEEFLPRVWAALNARPFEGTLSADETQLLSLLNSTVLDASFNTPLLSPLSSFASPPYGSADVAGTLAVALREIVAFEAGLEAVEEAFRYREEGAATATDGTAAVLDARWPTFLFPLADPAANATTRGPVPPVLPAVELTDPAPFENDKRQIDALADLIERLAPATAAVSGATEVALPAGQLDHKYAFFAVRCVYERPDCGPLFPALVSAASQMFQMAPFFDPDAPARQIRIPMPVDITPAGLRKHNRNASFVISDMLCGRLKRMKKYTFGDLVLSVLPWPFHKDLPDPGETGPCDDGGLNFGMICSLSIPIVTLCAFILLIIMVTLFDLFFRWLPFLMLCLPIPGLKAKS